MSQWIAVSSTAAVAPSNGRGGATTAISTFTPATIFVPAGVPSAGAWPTKPFVASSNANTMDGVWGGGGLTPAVGDVVAAAAGYWGVITKITADAVTTGGTTYDVFEIDRWRKMGVLNSNGVPTAGDDLALVRGIYSQKGERWVIDWIDFTGNNQTTAQALTICDLNGVAIPGLTFQNQAQPATPAYFPNMHNFATGQTQFGDTFVELDQPFTVKTANAGATATIGFRVLAP